VVYEKPPADRRARMDRDPRHRTRNLADEPGNEKMPALKEKMGYTMMDKRVKPLVQDHDLQDAARRRIAFLDRADLFRKDRGYNKYFQEKKYRENQDNKQ
jgi:hypothetical protein